MMFYRPRRIAPVDASLVTQLRQALAEKTALEQELAALKQSRDFVINMLNAEHDMRVLENKHLTNVISKNTKLMRTNARLTAELAALKGNNAYYMPENDRLQIAFDKLKACLVCPITKDLFKDPVMASDGHLYERVSIQAWFRMKEGFPRSPMTNLVLPNKTVVPCFVVREIVAIIAANCTSDDLSGI